MHSCTCWHVCRIQEGVQMTKQEKEVYIIFRDTNKDNQIVLIYENYKEGLEKFNWMILFNPNDKFRYEPWSVVV